MNKMMFCFLLSVSFVSFSNAYTRYGFDINFSKLVEPVYVSNNPYSHFSIGENLSFNLINIERYYTRVYSIRNTLGAGLGLNNSTTFMSVFHEVIGSYNFNNNLKIGIGLNSQLFPFFNYHAIDTDLNYFKKDQLLSVISIAPVVNFRFSFDTPKMNIPNTYGVSFTYRNYKFNDYTIKASQVSFYYGFIF
ncbi:MAG: hypothetical protein HRU38_15095 [Saccharospirillaceae bacterium]|nr:hypothetical protein [Pseudomonadales bacterium]NRB79968.1 hypothetical protein [Saccharospirillaceae bacterium]